MSELSEDSFLEDEDDRIILCRHGMFFCERCLAEDGREMRVFEDE